MLVEHQLRDKSETVWICEVAVGKRMALRETSVMVLGLVLLTKVIVSDIACMQAESHLSCKAEQEVMCSHVSAIGR